MVLFVFESSEKEILGGFDRWPMNMSRGGRKLNGTHIRFSWRENLGSSFSPWADQCSSIVRFLEGDFETYVRQMRQPHIWGGEPELLMCSHVLQWVWIHSQLFFGIRIHRFLCPYQVSSMWFCMQMHVEITVGTRLSVFFLSNDQLIEILFPAEPLQDHLGGSFLIPTIHVFISDTECASICCYP